MKKIYFCFIFILNNLVFGELLVIDEFKNINKNSLGGGILCFTSHKSVKINISLNKNETRQGSGSCLQIDYNLGLEDEISSPSPFNYEDKTSYHYLFTDYYSKSQNFAAYLSEIKKGNFKNFQYLILYLKGDKELGYTRSLNVELKDGRRTASYKIEGITTEWQKFVIPLKDFSGIDLSKVKYLGLCFWSDVVTKKFGRIYVDDIYLSKSVYVIKRKIKVRRVEKSARWIKLDNNENLEFGKIDSKKDLDARFALQYDEDYLYVLVNVVDNEVINNEIDEDIWREDCIEVFIDPQNDGLLWGSEEDFQIGISRSRGESDIKTWAWFQQRCPETQEVNVIKEKVGERKYIFKIAISWKFLGIVPKEGEKFGFSIAINDFDLKDGSSGKLNYCFIKEPFKEEIFLADVILK